MTAISFTLAEIAAYQDAGVWTEAEAASWREKAPVEFDGEVKPVPSGGPDVPWRQWVPEYYLRRDCGPFADFHENLWEWFDAIELDKKAAPAVVPWARGLGKSSTLEGGILRTCVKGTRRFWIYVSRTLEDANNHVMAMARAMEKMGIERQVTKYGLATGWNAQRLRTSSGFSILSFGLDAGARGVKLDDVRPDGIALDDVDFLGDTVEAIEKKLRTISGTILQAGSPNFVAVFVQNPIAQNSVFSRTLDGRAGILTNRVPALAKLIPAIYDFEYETYFNEQGLECAKITGGRSSWEGKTMEDWQYQIEIGGIQAFLIECQHEIHIGSTFFQNYSAEDHHIAPIYTPLGIPGPNVPKWFTAFGGLDWGYDDDDPTSFCLCISDDTGRVHALESWYENYKSNDEYGAKVCVTLDRWGIDKSKCKIYADGSMWNQQTINGQKAEANVEGFFRNGLKMVAGAVGPLPNENRNTTVRNFLGVAEKFVAYRGYNQVLVKALENASPQKNNRNAVLHDIYSHAVVSIGHALGSRPKPSNIPEDAKTPERKEQEAAERQATLERDLAEYRLIQSNERLGYLPKRDENKLILRNEDGTIQWEWKTPKRR